MINKLHIYYKEDELNHMRVLLKFFSYKYKIKTIDEDQWALLEESTP